MKPPSKNPYADWDDPLSSPYYPMDPSPYHKYGYGHPEQVLGSSSLEWTLNQVHQTYGSKAAYMFKDVVYQAYGMVDIADDARRKSAAAYEAKIAAHEATKKELIAAHEATKKELAVAQDSIAKLIAAAAAYACECCAPATSPEVVP